MNGILEASKIKEKITSKKDLIHKVVGQLLKSEKVFKYVNLVYPKEAQTFIKMVNQKIVEESGLLELITLINRRIKLYIVRARSD